MTLVISGSMGWAREEKGHDRREGARYIVVLEWMNGGLAMGGRVSKEGGLGISIPPTY